MSVIEVSFLEDSSATIMARIESRPLAPGARGTPFVQADFSSISYSVYDVTSTPAVVTGHDAVALTIASVVFNTLQPWSVDVLGHNVRFTIAATGFPTGGNKYRVEVKWTLTDGTVGFTLFEGTAAAVHSS